MGTKITLPVEVGAEHNSEWELVESLGIKSLHLPLQISDSIGTKINI